MGDASDDVYDAMWRDFHNDDPEDDMSEYLMRAVSFGNDTIPCPHSGQFLETFDHNAFAGQGHGTFTSDPDKAMRFASAGEAMAFWNKPSTVLPLRPDGKPNKPLTALTVSIEPAP